VAIATYPATLPAVRAGLPALPVAVVCSCRCSPIT